MPRDTRETDSPFPCSAEVTFTHHEGMCDVSGHQIRIVHWEYVMWIVCAIERVRMMHRPDHEDFVPRCVHDGRVWPCPTFTAVSR